MTIVRLVTRRVEKPWGRHDLWPGFDNPAPDEEPVGEIWFEDPRGGDPELLVKYLFTAERLSIQVHPGDAQAVEMGLTRGKDEAWLILDAEPESTIGLGTRRALSSNELRAAALDGSLEELVDWRPAAKGDVFYSPSGTIHAIGAGLTLVEVQQNSETTFRLFDYGRPRELHLDESIAAARAVPYQSPFEPKEIAPGRTILTRGPAFVLERLQGVHDRRLDSTGPLWLIPLAGRGAVDGEAVFPGGAWLLEDRPRVRLDGGSDMLLAYSGDRPLA